MKPKVYIETSVISYLVAQTSQNLSIAENQQSTHTWWHNQRDQFDLLISQVVIEEASSGNEEFAQLRLQALQGIPWLTLNDKVMTLAEELVTNGPIPPKATQDALHIAVAAIHDIDYLLTWNFKHMANTTIRTQIENYCRSKGYAPSFICTPRRLQELLEEERNVE